MKKSITLFVFILATQIAIGQGVGVGTTNPNASAALDVSSTTQGMLVPRMTTAQRTAISTPATGLLIFDMTTNSFWFKGGTTWVQLIDSSNTVVQVNGTNLYMGMLGNIGIGTNEPMSKLEVMTPTDSLGITHTNGTVQLSTRITATSAEVSTISNHALNFNAGPSATNLTLPPTGGIYIGPGLAPSMPQTTLHVQGNTSIIGLVGVGTESPTSKLDVKTEPAFPAMTLRDGTVTLTVEMETDKAVIKTETASALQLNANNGTDHLTIATSGMVGIGTPTPELPLSFANTFGGKVALKKTAASYYGFGVSPGAMLIHSDGPSSDILFGHNSGVFAELARMKGTGSFGIGTNNPTAMLSVVRGTSPDGTAAFLGSTHNSYFNKGANEDTYINGGKAGSNVLINSAAGLGFVGIGTASPLQMLHVAGGGFFGAALGLGIVAPSFPLHFSATSGDKIALSGSPGALFGFGIQPNLMQVIAPNTSADIGFGTGSSSTFSEKMRLTGDGDLGIGTESPSTKLDVNGDANVSGGLAVGLGLAVGAGVAVGGGLSVDGTVGIGTQSPDPSAILDLDSHDKGLLMPRMTSTEREGIDTPAEGLTVYDMTTKSPWYHDQNDWKEMHSDSIVNVEVYRTGQDEIYLGLTDSVGIGTTSPDYKLQVSTADNTDGISHTNGNVNIVTHVENSDGGSIGTKSNHDFEIYANDGDNQFVLKPTGNIGVGLEPTNKLDIAEMTRTGSHPSNLPLYVTGDIGTNANGMEVRVNDGTQGVGIGSTTVYATGAIQDLRMEAKGTTGNLKFATNGAERMSVSGAGNVGIGTIAPNAPLQFASVEANRKIVLFENGNNNHQYFGFGINSSALRYQAQGDHVFFNGVNATTSTELMRIEGSSGEVGIGLGIGSTPANKLDVAAATRTGTTHPINLPLYVTGNIGTNTGGMEIRKTDGTQGIGIGSTTVYATGAIQDLRMEAKGVTGNLKFTTNTVERMAITGAGNVGIGNSSPNAPLQFANLTSNRKIVMWENGNNDNEYYGFGVNSNVLRYQTQGDHVFYNGVNATTSTELMRIEGSSGEVGIGLGIGSTPANKLDVAAATRTGTTHPINLPLYVTGNIGTNTGGMEIRKTDGTQGIGIGSTTVYATGAIQDLCMEAKGLTGNVIHTTNGTERVRVTGDGRVGIGITNPDAMLEITRGTAPFGNLQVNGTTYNSHFNYGSPEDTYIRGGKAGAKVIINDYWDHGNVGIGTDMPLQKLHVGGNVAVSNNVGIGNTDPHAPLQFNSADATRKIVLKEFQDNDHQFSGFGATADGLSYHVPYDDASHIFYSGTGAPASNEIMRIAGYGNVGIGDTSPDDKLDVVGDVDVSGQVKMGYSIHDQNHNLGPLFYGVVSCDCPAGSLAIGGGWSGDGLDVVGSYPDNNGAKWSIVVHNWDAFNTKLITVRVTCARIGN